MVDSGFDPIIGALNTSLNLRLANQNVISSNIANADTPKYASRDIKAFDFQAELRREKKQSNPNTVPVNMKITDPKHIAKAGDSSNRDFKVTEDRRPYESAPDGNQVVLEEQMLRMNETQANHSTMTQLYKKHVAMFKTVIRSSGG